jgi:mannose-6-phosphate isomerase-like protein (cupin superfamily)
MAGGGEVIEKAWGTEEVLVDEREYCAKRLRITPSKRCSLHYHPRKKETFVVESGIVRLEQRDVRGAAIDETLAAGDSRTIAPGTPHRFSSREGAVVLEVSTRHDDLDVVRIEPSGDADFA